MKGIKALCISLSAMTMICHFFLEAKSLPLVHLKMAEDPATKAVLPEESSEDDSHLIQKGAY